MKSILISFDVWDTLLTSNADFKKMRENLIAAYLGVNESNVAATYKNTKFILDMLQEDHSIALSHKASWKIFCKNLSKNSNWYWFEKDEKVLNNLMQLNTIAFNANLPHYEYGLFEEIGKLKKELKNLDYLPKIGIISNTGLVSGEMLRSYIESYSLGEDGKDIFDFYFFSDEHKLCKPDPAMFEISKNFHKAYHIGDNKLTDGGCEVYDNYTFIKTLGSYKTLPKIKELIFKLKTQTHGDNHNA